MVDAVGKQPPRSLKAEVHDSEKMSERGSSSLTSCPVCAGSPCALFCEAGGKRYFECSVCGAVFLDLVARLDRESEFVRYTLHNNSPDDPRYEAFLSRLADPVFAFLPPCGEGLDFGCGPEPLLSRMFEKEGHNMKNYDPFFFPDASALNASYDFIVCSEAAEHFHRPAREFALLDGLLRPGGVLAVMTSFLEDGIDFPNWRYRRDETHVVFYRETTFRTIADRFGWEPLLPARNVVLLVKP